MTGPGPGADDADRRRAEGGDADRRTQEGGAGRQPEKGGAGRQPEKGGAGRQAETDWERRRRLAAVFGDVLPETTRDEREPGERGGEDGRRESASEDWLRRQVPPHHG